MEDDFLSELDQKVSNVNLDKYWERKVGDHVLWLAPIDYTWQIRVKEALQDPDAANILEETKRLTVAGSLVGFDGMDMRGKRQLGKIFKIKGAEGRKDEQVDLSEYLYRKLAHWDAEFIDLVFEVFADLMESHKKEMSTSILFENARTPREELVELEMKVTELRERLKLPPLIEATEREEDKEKPAISAPENLEETQEEPEPELEPEPPPRKVAKAKPKAPVEDEEDFDPFKKLDEAPKQQAAPTFPVPKPPITSPERDLSPIERELAKRQGVVPSTARTPVGQVSSSEVPIQAQPSVSPDVIEKPLDAVVVPPPKIDPRVETQNRNPRFARPHQR